MKIGLKCFSLAVAFFVSIFLLVGCNDDSGSSSSNIKYTGSTEQVLIDEDNAIEVATNAYLNIDSMVSAGDVAYNGMILEYDETAPAMPYNVVLALSLIDVLEKAEIFIIRDGAVYTGAVNDSWTIDGECGGEAVINWSYHNDTDEMSMTMKFNHYCTRRGITLNGIVKIEADLSSGDYLMTFKMLESTLESSGQSITICGTIEIDEINMSTFFVMNMTMRDNTTDKTYEVEDMEVEIIDGGSEFEVIISGRFYNHDYGYCDISTEVSIKFLENDIMPYEGSLLIEGANGTKAQLTIIDSDSYQVGADTNGDGIFNYSSGAQPW